MTKYHSFPGIEIDYDAPAEEHEVAFLQYAKEHPDKLTLVYEHIFNWFLMTKKYEKALEYNLLAIASCKNDEDLGNQYGWQALLYDWWGKKEKAVEPGIKATEYDPTSHERLVQLGNTYIELKDYKNAVAVFDKLMKMPKDDDDNINDWHELYYESMASLYTEEKDYTLANKIYDKLLKEAETDDAKANIYSLLSAMYESAQNYKDAVSNAKRAVKLAPDMYSFIEKLAKLYLDNKQYDDALATYKKILKIKNTDNEDKSFYKKLYYTCLGELYFTMNKPDEAIENFKKNLSLHKNKDETYHTLEQICAVYQQQRRYEEALPYLKKILKLWPMKYPRAYTSMATYYYQEKHDPENAFNYLKVAAEANHHGDWQFFGNDKVIAGTIFGFLGILYNKDFKDEEKAIENFEKALKCEPEKAIEGEICDALYKIYMDRGDEEKANEYKAKRSPLKLIMSMFSGDWTPPPPKTLYERLRNPINTSEEIQGLPHHYSKIPKGIVEKSEYVQKLNMDFENDLLTNPKYKEFFDAHDPFYNIGFIRNYVKHKMDLIEQYQWYIDPDDDIHAILFREQRERILEMILHKKLFNMQLLWRAEQITIPEIKTTNDFALFEDHVFECPFLEPITAQEIEVAKEYILYDDFQDERYSSFIEWQNYDALMAKNEEGEENNMPPWYNFYDEKMNTGALLLLPNTRGEKEDVYMQKYWVWKRKQPPEVYEKPAVPYVHKTALFASDDHLVEFIEKFEDDYICNLHQNWMNDKAFPDKTYNDDAVRSAIHELEYAEEPPIIETGLLWHEAIIKCAAKYKNKKIVAHLDEVYSDYKMKLELNLFHKEQMEFEVQKIKNCTDANERILKARELSGEPRDFNF